MIEPIVFRAALAVAALALATGPAPAAQAEPDPAAIDTIFARYDNTNTPGCAVGVFRNEQIVFRRGYGMADLNQGIAISPETVFYIASTSKQFAALSVALLAEQGRIDLDDPVRKYVPELPPYADSITVRHLVLHTSGIRDYLGLWSLSGRSYADEIPEEVALELITRQKAADFPPGARWSYSNSGYFLLSVIVKRASGKSLREYTDEHMFRPLGMASTHFHDDNSMIVRRRAEGYVPDGRGGFRIVRTSFALVGDGGLLSSVTDLARYDANFYHNRVGTRGQALIDQLTTPGSLAGGKPLTYGFGLMMEKHRGLPVVMHGGAFIGFRAQLVRFPAEKFSVAVLCNDGTADPDDLAFRVAELYLGDKLGPREASAPTVTVAPAALDRLVGRYELNPGMIADVTRTGTGLGLSLGGPRAPLRPIADTAFTAEGLPGVLVFSRLEDGTIGLAAPGIGVTEAARRIPPPPSLSAAEREGYVGRYTSEELDTWSVIEAKDEGLRIRVRFAPWMTLRPLRKDEFLIQGATLVFERDQRGRVTGYRVDTARARGIRFARVAIR